MSSTPDFCGLSDRKQAEVFLCAYLKESRLIKQRVAILSLWPLFTFSYYCAKNLCKIRCWIQSYVLNKSYIFLINCIYYRKRTTYNQYCNVVTQIRRVRTEFLSSVYVVGFLRNTSIYIWFLLNFFVVLISSFSECAFSGCILRLLFTRISCHQSSKCTCTTQSFILLPKVGYT